MWGRDFISPESESHFFNNSDRRGGMPECERWTQRWRGGQTGKEEGGKPGTEEEGGEPGRRRRGVNQEGGAPSSRDSNWPKLGVSVLTCRHGNSSIIGGISVQGVSVGQRKENYHDVSETNGRGEEGQKQND